MVVLAETEMDNRHSFLRLQPRTFAYAKVRNLLTFFLVAWCPSSFGDSRQASNLHRCVWLTLALVQG
jgi:hypothetical protein